MKKELKDVKRRLSQYLIDEEYIDEIDLPELVENITFDVLMEKKKSEIFERTNDIWYYIADEFVGSAN